jgi:hypothetical protein
MDSHIDYQKPRRLRRVIATSAALIGLLSAGLCTAGAASAEVSPPPCMGSVDGDDCGWPGGTGGAGAPGGSGGSGGGGGGYGNWIADQFHFVTTNPWDYDVRNDGLPADQGQADQLRRDLNYRSCWVVAPVGDVSCSDY